MYQNGKNIAFTDRSNPCVDMILRSMKTYKRLTNDEEYELWQQIQQGSEKAREQLILANCRYVVTVAKEFLLSQAPFEDLLMAGLVGLINAVDRFDASRGTRLISYATWYIRNEVMLTANDYNNYNKTYSSYDEPYRADDNDNADSKAEHLCDFKNSAPDWHLNYSSILDSVKSRLDKACWLGAGEMLDTYLSMTEKGCSVREFARKYRLSDFQLRNYLKAVNRETLYILQAA